MAKTDFIINWLRANSIAVAALGISLLNLIHSFTKDRRDKAHVLAHSVYWQALHDRSSTMEIEIVNRGRRPVTLISMCWKDRNGIWRGVPFSVEGQRLNESERRPFPISDFDHIIYDSEHDWLPTALFFEDSLRKKHKVKNAGGHLKRLFRKDGYTPIKPGPVAADIITT